MRDLLYKEFRLALHPTAVIFLSLSVLLIIPNYPYYMTFFYTGLGIFFVCLTGRENNDILYTVMLPLRKGAAVSGRFAFTIIIELLQVLVAIPFAALRQILIPAGNQVGMDANIAFFGLSFILLGLFNLVFFTSYYKAPDKVGSAFLKSSVAITLYIIVAEACAHAVPFVKNYLDTPDPQFVAYKLITLAIGIAIFAALTFFAYRRSQKSFEALDL